MYRNMTNNSIQFSEFLHAHLTVTHIQVRLPWWLLPAV